MRTLTIATVLLLVVACADDLESTGEVPIDAAASAARGVDEVAVGPDNVLLAAARNLPAHTPQAAASCQGPIFECSGWYCCGRFTECRTCYVCTYCPDSKSCQVTGRFSRSSPGCY